MATKRILPPRPEQVSPSQPSDEADAHAESLQQSEERKLKQAVGASSRALVLIAIAIVLVICYFAKVILVTLMVSVLLAFVLEPLVDLLERFRVPRSAGALLAVVLLLGICFGASYFFYNRAISFAHELPRYSREIRGSLAKFSRQSEDLKRTTSQILPPAVKPDKNAIPVKVENASGSDMLTKNLGTVTDIVVSVLFIPFLVYFMLGWRDHARSKTVELFPPERRTTAYVTLGQISLMMRSFISGNFLIGLFMSMGSLIVFGLLGLPYFYFIAFISGFVSLVPYLGVILAAIPPLTAGLGVVHEAGFIAIIATVVGLHVVSTSVLYPKFLGRRLQLNPLVVTIALLVWGWIWGTVGLVLAVPVTGAIKIVCDHVPSLRALGAWMGE